MLQGYEEQAMVSRRKWPRRQTTGLSIQQILMEVGRAHKLLDQAEELGSTDMADSVRAIVEDTLDWALRSFQLLSPTIEERTTFLVETEMLRRRLYP